MMPLCFSSRYWSFWFSSRETRKKVVTRRVKRLQDIDFARLHQEGIRLLIFDYDDTLAGLREPLSEPVRQFLREHSSDRQEAPFTFHLAIQSNRPSSHDQVRSILDDTVLSFNISSYRKPHPEAFLPILREYALEPKQAAMIGDRGGTDMWGAYRLGFRERILIAPYSDKTRRFQAPLLFRALRKAENLFLA